MHNQFVFEGAWLKAFFHNNMQCFIFHSLIARAVDEFYSGNTILPE